MPCCFATMQSEMLLIPLAILVICLFFALRMYQKKSFEYDNLYNLYNSNIDRLIAEVYEIKHKIEVSTIATNNKLKEFSELLDDYENLCIEIDSILLNVVETDDLYQYKNAYKNIVERLNHYLKQIKNKNE